MAGVMASVLANLPDSASNRLREFLNQRAGLTALDDAPNNSSNPAGEAGAAVDVDRVTLAGPGDVPDQRQPGLDASGLYSLMESLQGAQSGSVQQQTMQASLTTSAAAALELMFTNVGRNSRNASFNGMLNSLDAKLAQLADGDSEQASRLQVLLSALAKLNPEGAERILGLIDDALSNVLAARNAFQVSPQAAAPQAAAPQAAQSGEMVHFSLDLEVEMTSEIEVVLSEMNDEGIEVRAARIRSTERVAIHIEFTGIRQQTQKSDPLILDLEGDGVELTGIDDGADFDIDGDGRTDRTSFVQGDDAFLALDRNGNGSIDSGRELFGDQNGALNGFEELSRHDDNRDGKIDANDAIFGSLRLMHDKNGDGAVGANELSTLAEQGIQSLDLSYLNGARDDRHGNTLAESSQFARADGGRGQMVDAWLTYR